MVGGCISRRDQSEEDSCFGKSSACQAAVAVAHFCPFLWRAGAAFKNVQVICLYVLLSVWGNHSCIIIDINQYVYLEPLASKEETLL